jgi:two-component system, NarL family, sensor kinase
LNAAEERERERIRRDLHEGVRPILRSLIIIAHTALKENDPNKTRSALKELRKRLKDCDAELLEVIEHLRPTALANGLEPALRAQCEAFRNPALRVELELSGDFDDLPSAIVVATYRIVSEALHNVSRHAQAQTCRVTVGRRRTVLTFEIADDGVGLVWPPPRSSGLASMKDRAHELGGVCAVAPNEPSGTVIRVRLPLVGRVPEA